MLNKPRCITITLIGGAMFISTLAFCASPWGWNRHPEFVGQVLDAETAQPIEGGYALLVYLGAGGGPAGHTSSWCVRTRGMYTGKDGKFSFPVDNRGGGHPNIVHAIKSGYFLDVAATAAYNTKKRKHDTPEKWDVLLKKQDPAKPSFQFGFQDCERPESEAAIEAALNFMSIAVMEEKKYGKDVRSIKAGEDQMQFMRKYAETRAKTKN